MIHHNSPFKKQINIMDVLLYIYLFMTAIGLVFLNSGFPDMMFFFLYAGASSIVLSPIMAVNCSTELLFLSIILLIVGTAMFLLLIPLVCIAKKRKNYKIFGVYLLADWLIGFIYTVWSFVVNWDTYYVWETVFPGVIAKTLFFVVFVLCYRKTIEKSNIDKADKITS